MAKDVIITPASGLIDFKNTTGVSTATIQLSDTGTFSIGNTASNLYIGDGTNSVDIIFEQNGKIRALTNKTLTIGQSDSFLTVDAPVTYISPDATKNISSSMLNTGALSFRGSAGELFSITNSLSGTIFSVNDVSGIPSIEVLDTGAVKIAQYSGNVGIGTSSIAEKLVVNGAIQAKSGSTSGFNSNHVGYTFINDNDSGMFNSSDGVLSLASNGADVLIVNSGSVGIGVTPTGAGKLEVDGKIDTQNVMANTWGSIGQYDAVSGSSITWYNAGFRNDASNVYLLSSAVQTTEALAKAASYNSFRPFSWNLSTGVLSLCSSGQAVTTAGQIQSSYSAGAPFTVASTTVVANLNASLLNGATFAAPGAIGGTTASTGAFTTLSASSTITTASNQLAMGNILSTASSLVAGNWYRIATFHATNQGQSVEIHVRHGNTHNNTIIKVAKGTGQWRAEVYRAGYYVNPTANAAYPAINKVRIVDIAVNDVTHIDIKILGNTVLHTYNVIVNNNISESIDTKITLIAFTNQGTTAAGVEFQSIGTMASWGNNNGQLVTFDESGNVGIGVGTTSPLTYGGKLSIANDSSAGLNGLNITNLNSASNVTKYARLSFGGVDTLSTWKSTGNISIIPNEENYIGSIMTFSTRTSDSVAEKMRIDGAGNVTAVGTIQSSAGFILNKSTITANYTIAAGVNAMSTGPITINNGVTVTVTAGQRWVVI